MSVVGDPIFTPESLPSYLDLAAALELAAGLPSNQVAAFTASSSSQQAAALAAATRDIDGERWQGRKFSPTQVLEFPRIPFGGVGESRWPGMYVPELYGIEPVGRAQVWDWDLATNAAVVPQNVKLACLYQAESILNGKRLRTEEAQHEGITGRLDHFEVFLREG